jgi:ABC-type Fe3+/spermidine/putrescine transport system ATPase subunit
VGDSPPVLEVRGVTVRLGGRPVLRDLDLTVRDGELLALLGPNGAGKTTLLRTIAGFERPTTGSVRLDGRELGRTPPHRRKIGLLFQDPALFPNRTVFENVAYAPLLQRWPEDQVRAEVERLAELLSLGPLLDRRPSELSGGERQRTALARTLAARPRLVLLDEPFASVDVEVKADLRTQFRAALRASDTAAIHVTHDREEGLFLGDRVALLFDGKLEATGPSELLYRHPGSARAARFLGYNVVDGPAGPVAVHPEDVLLGSSTEDGAPYRVVARGTTGRRSVVILEGPDGERLEACLDTPPALDATVRASWRRSEPVTDAEDLPRARRAA